ncbi:hypothetical protein [Bradyrhizobium sp. USDA 3315]
MPALSLAACSSVWTRTCEKFEPKRGSMKLRTAGASGVPPPMLPAISEVTLGDAIDPAIAAAGVDPGASAACVGADARWT